MTWAGLANCASSEQLATDLREFIVREPFTGGERLPTIRELSALSGLGRNEVYRALLRLAADGWVVQKRGAGTFVGPRKAETPSPAREAGGRKPAPRRIGVIPPGWDPRASHQTVGATVHGIGVHASRRGYRVEIIASEADEYTQPNFADRVLALGLDGVIWIQPSYDFPLALVRLREANFPLVLTNRGFPGLDVPTACMDYARLGELVADFMVHHGRKRLVALVGCRDDLYTQAHVTGLRQALEQRGLELPEHRLLTTRVGHIERFYSMDLTRTTEHFFERNQDFDAVYSLYPDFLEVLHQLHQSGEKHCPEDYIHVHFIRSSLPLHLTWQEMPLAFVEPPSAEVGLCALRELERLWGVSDGNPIVPPAPVLHTDPRLREASVRQESLSA